jgi:hypothetical protein
MQSFTKGIFPFPYAELKSLFANPRAKNMIFPHIRTQTILQHAYTEVAPLQPAYIGKVHKIKKWCRVSMSRHEINDPLPSIYWKHSESSLQFHLKAINGPNLSYGKEEKEFNFESKVTLEKLFTSH